MGEINILIKITNLIEKEKYFVKITNLDEKEKILKKRNIFKKMTNYEEKDILKTLVLFCKLK